MNIGGFHSPFAAVILQLYPLAEPDVGQTFTQCELNISTTFSTLTALYQGLQGKARFSVLSEFFNTITSSLVKFNLVTKSSS